MNRRDEKHLSGLYKKAPQLSSPEDLDKRIMQSARDLRPEKKATYWNSWMPLVASLCVAGLGVYTILPLIQPSQKSAPLDLEVRSDSSSSSNLVVEEQAEQPRKKSAAPAAAQLAAPPSALEPATAAPTAEVIGSAAQQYSLEQEQPSLSETLDQEKSFRLQSTMKVANEAKQMEFTADRDDRQSLQRESTAATAAAPETSTAASGAMRPVLSIEVIDRRLARIRELKERELTEQAQKLLDQLIEQCPNCGIPTKLAELR